MSPNPQTSESLVLGTAFNYTTDEVRVFVQSLRRYYHGQIMLLVSSRDSDELLAYLSQQQVTPVFFDSALWMTGHISTTRYIRYGEVLRGAAGRHGRVLLTDVRDVCFQGHPFDSAPPGDLLCYLEVEGRSIGDCQINSRWILDLFGPQELQKLSSRGISCSGTTLGTAEAILDYIDRLMAHAPPRVLAPFADHPGHDQGIHNYLLRNGLLPKARIIPNGVHVLTIGAMFWDQLILAADGKILTQQGVLCPIVHQYTQCPRLAQQVCAEYGVVPPASGSQ